MEAPNQIRLHNPAGWSVSEHRVEGLEDLRNPVWGVDFNVTQLNPGFENGSITHAVFDQVVFSFGEIKTSSALRVHGALSPDFIYCLACLGTPRTASSGGKACASSDMGTVLAAAGGQEFDAVYRPGVIQFSAIAVSERVYHELAERIAPRLKRMRPQIVFQPSPERRSQIVRNIYAAAGAVKKAAPLPESLDHHEVRAQIMSAFVMAMDPDGGSIRLRSREKAIISRVEELVRASELGLSIPMMCVQLGESRRKVERVFRRELNTSPAHFVTMFRLCRAREDLAQGNGTVTTVAAKYGFYELGRFAARYKSFFGEYPSDTLSSGRNGAMVRETGTAMPQTVDVLRRDLS